MRTFASKTSKPQSGGFTLLEILVVVSLVAILTGVVMLSFTGADAEQRLQGEAERFATRMRLARQMALQRNREWGLYVEEQDYHFAEFDPYERLWLEQVERPFQAVSVPPEIRLRVEITADGAYLPKGDQFETEGDKKEEGTAEPPDVWIFSSGEVTPFRLEFRNQTERTPIAVTSDGLSPANLERDE